MPPMEPDAPLPEAPSLAVTVQRFRDFYKSILNQEGEMRLRKIFSLERELSQRLQEPEKGIFLAMIQQLEGELLPGNDQL